MSDYFIDFRQPSDREKTEVEKLLKYFEETIIDRFHFDKFTLITSRVDDMALWGPYSSADKSAFVSLAGRIALDDDEWEKAREIDGDGGLACKYIYGIYRTEGIRGLKKLNGSYVALLYDETMHKLYIVVDRCGMFPCFGAVTYDGYATISSHPDVIAKVLGINRNVDMTSMAEFLSTGKVSFPYTFYNQIRSLDFASIHTIDMNGQTAKYQSGERYFYFNYDINHKMSEWDLAEELAGAFRKAVRRRTSLRFGKTAIALSGGLDSRTILCSTDNKDSLICFSFYDDENLEYRISKSIAKEAGVELVRFQRDFDHYGHTAEMGVRISGGMGSFFNNHFLGFRTRFRELGITNLVTGFYCDYFFKGLALDFTRENVRRKEVLTRYDHQWYRPCFWFRTSYADKVQERLNRVFPEEVRDDNSDLGKLRIEGRRLFPLCYEPDNAETTIPQKVLGWYLPIVDNDILQVYLSIPPKYKLNVSMYSKMVELQCGKCISRIPDSNTGAPVNASQPTMLYHKYVTALRSRFEKRIAPKMSTSGSWPNWEFYVHHSDVIRSAWFGDNSTARDILHQIMGKDPYNSKIQSYVGKEIDLFSRMLTLKIWVGLNLGPHY